MEQKEIGTFIASLRKEKNLTQAALGEMLGVTNKTVSRWENGNYMPDISILQELCVCLDITVNELLSGRRLEEKEFKGEAEKNLVNSMNQLEKLTRLKKNKKIIDSMSGAATGIFISLLLSPKSMRTVIMLCVAVILYLTSSILSTQYDKDFLRLIEEEKQEG